MIPAGILCYNSGQMEKARGRFIVFEGLDGSGHTTQIEKFRAYAALKGRTLLVTHEPTEESDAGLRARRILRHEEPMPSPADFQLLYVDDRKHHVDTVIEPALRDGIDVVSDRYYFSTIAFGSIGGVAVEWLRDINSAFPHPDLTFIIDAAPKTCLARIGKRGTPLELFEREEKLSRARETYNMLPGMYPNVFMIDGEPDIETVWSSVKKIADTNF